MIKVGQIYNIPYLGGKVVVTWIRADGGGIKENHI